MSALPADVRDNPAESRYELTTDGEVEAYVVYERPVDVPGLLDLQHTITVEGHEGHGVAGRLVDAVLAEAREQGWTIRPTCPYVRHYLIKHPEQLDLVSDDDKVAFELG